MSPGISVIIPVLHEGAGINALIEHIRRGDQSGYAYLIMLTGRSETSDLVAGMEAGADDFLTKPVNALELTVRVKSLLRVRHLKSELERTLAYLESLEKKDA